MFWFGLTIGALMVLAIVMLATPIKLRATWSGDTQKVVIRYLGFGRTTDFLGKTRTFDWLGLRLSEKPAGPITKQKKKPKPAKEKVKKKKPEQKPIPAGVRLRILVAHRRTLADTLKRVFGYLRRLVLCPELRLAKLDVTGGAANPALTGIYYGWFASLQPALNTERVRINWQPDFARPGFTAQFDGSIWLRPWHPVRHTAGLAIHLPKRGLYRLYKAMKNKEG